MTQSHWRKVQQKQREQEKERRSNRIKTITDRAKAVIKANEERNG